MFRFCRNITGSNAFFGKTYSDSPPKQSRRVSTEFEMSDILSKKPDLRRYYSSKTLSKYAKTGSSCRHWRFNTSAQALFQMLNNNQWELSNWEKSKQ